MSQGYAIPGTVENPGTNVAQERGLNRSISNQGCSLLRRRIEDKAGTCGVDVIAINPSFTSKRCSVCGHTDSKNRESQTVFACRACGQTDNADVNTARNIPAEGLAVTARGGTPVYGPDKARQLELRLPRERCCRGPSSSPAAVRRDEPGPDAEDRRAGQGLRHSELRSRGEQDARTQVGSTGAAGWT